jgi:hypothetical protein
MDRPIETLKNKGVLTGDYWGLWGGYTIELTQRENPTRGFREKVDPALVITVETGIKGINVPVYVKITREKIEVWLERTL